MPVNRHHRQILSEIIKVSKAKSPDRVGFGLKYMGTDKPSFHLDIGTTKKIAKEYFKKQVLSTKEFESFIDSMYKGETCDEIFIAAKYVELSKENKKYFGLEHLDRWLNSVHGWAETDVLCQTGFTADDLLDRWQEWKKLITKLSKDKNVHKRRASLVLLTKPLRMSVDGKFATLAISNLERLKREKDILITKAVSWVLRAMIKNHKDLVSKYLKDNFDLLPKIAVREVTSKLTTGKKYINKKKNNQI